MKIVVADTNLIPHRQRFCDGLPDGATVVWADPADAETLHDAMVDADVFVGGRFPAHLAAAANRLRMVHVAGAGTDKIDFDALGPEVVVANTFHHEQSIAEYIVATAVLLRRQFLIQDRALRTGRWATSVYDRSIAQPAALKDARVGFVGFGHIGRRAWEVLRVLGADGIAVTGSGSLDAAAEGLRWTADTGDLGRLMSESDVVVVSAPLTERTVGMIGADELRALGPDGVLINVGRGPLVAEDALYEALSAGTIAGAAIDVWYQYPDGDGVGAPSRLPFGRLPNVLMTPHSSGVTGHTFTGRVDDIVANIGRLQRGEPLRNVVSR
ncbi:2-hydroxyacid dehydrogenase [Mycolicibacterium litorale]|uniref:2-hydroxyacid dehydrogenase n=1 Tax=Mycolicibacterium litorale TaxID=758802 RepID=A0AAD1IPG6_9MYCO|nr:2-hydroxyacid dehydrogenase [Mycolicibacterium litorale]MCV7417984.1 hydroxyacid dehydrogenase [Mycolicibacterium litorale]BBY19224.1 2-hydroxyacid dehydrogenase [Mycolicibacterium litorale]